MFWKAILFDSPPSGLPGVEAGLGVLALLAGTVPGRLTLGSCLVAGAVLPATSAFAAAPTYLLGVEPGGAIRPPEALTMP